MRNHPFFAVRLPKTGATVICLYEESDENGIGNAFDVVTPDSGILGGRQDRADGTIRIIMPDGVEEILDASSITWTGICVSVTGPDASIVLEHEDVDPQADVVTLYAAWFWSIRREAWADSMKACLDEDVPEPIDLDEDEAYENQIDPERRAVAMAYAA